MLLRIQAVHFTENEMIRLQYVIQTVKCYSSLEGIEHENILKILRVGIWTHRLWFSNGKNFKLIFEIVLWLQPQSCKLFPRLHLHLKFYENCKFIIRIVKSCSSSPLPSSIFFFIPGGSKDNKMKNENVHSNW